MADKKKYGVFVKSAVKPEGYPEDQKIEVAVIGRSNAGKSTLINHLCQKTLARVSSTPGKTDLLNFYNIGQNYRIVDTPGYGYARRGGKVVNSWRPMIEMYFSCRANLVGTILVMDVRRSWTEQEAELVGWLNEIKIPVMVVLTKSDKLSQSQISKRKKEISAIAEVASIKTTSLKKLHSYSLFEDHFYKEWVLPELNIKGEE